MKIALIKKQDDPLAVRISIGGFKTMGSMGYLTYRGDLEQVKLLLANALAGLKDIKVEPKIAYDNGKKYA